MGADAHNLTELSYRNANWTWQITETLENALNHYTAHQNHPALYARLTSVLLVHEETEGP